jgi:hypothetical protein
VNVLSGCAREPSWGFQKTLGSRSSTATGANMVHATVQQSGTASWGRRSDPELSASELVMQSGFPNASRSSGVAEAPIEKDARRA